MKKQQLSLLFHPLFLLSLLLLLLNDCYFKYQFHNAFTGKLSDFSGLFAFTIFFFSLFPDYKRAIIIVVFFFFAWWKSPLSDFVVDFFNYRLAISVHRVKDYSDLFATIILPLAMYVKPLSYIEGPVQKFAVWCIAIISFTAFTATTLPRRLIDDDKVLLDKHVKTKKEEETIIKVLEDHGLGPIKKTSIFEKMWQNNLYLKLKNSDSVMISADSLYAGVYRKLEYGDAYIIPKFYVAGDSVFNLRFIIYDFNSRKNELRLHSFEYKNRDVDTGYFSGYYAWRKFKKPIKKKIEALLSH